MPGMIDRLSLLPLLIGAALFLPGCASEVEYAPKDKVQTEEEAAEHRIFYEGWGRRGPSKEQKPYAPIEAQGLN